MWLGQRGLSVRFWEVSAYGKCLLAEVRLYLTISLRSYIKHSKECFIRYPNISKSAWPRFFNPHPDETLFLVFDISLTTKV